MASVRSWCLVVCCGWVFLFAEAEAYAPVRNPTGVADALRLFETATAAGEALQAQRAMYWIQRNYQAVLRATELTTLHPDCLLQVLSQPVSVAEIDVFRAVRRVLQSYDSTANTQRRIPRATLISTVRFYAIDSHLFSTEVIPSGLVPHHVVVQVLLKRSTGGGVVPPEYRRQWNQTILTGAGNVLTPTYGALMRSGSSFQLASACRGRNPLISTGQDNKDCYLESPLNQWVTVELPNRYVIQEIMLRSPSDSVRWCTKVRVETSADGWTFEPTTVFTNFYSIDTTSFSARPVMAIRYRVDSDGYCTTGGRSSGSRVSTIRVTNMRAYNK